MCLRVWCTAELLGARVQFTHALTTVYVCKTQNNDSSSKAEQQARSEADLQATLCVAFICDTPLPSDGLQVHYFKCSTNSVCHSYTY